MRMWQNRPAGSPPAARGMRIPEFRPLAWMDHAACRGHDPALWFPDDEPDPARRNPMREMARGICLACPVARQCGDHARATRPTAGIWAGLDRNTHGQPRAKRGPKPAGAPDGAAP